MNSKKTYPNEITEEIQKISNELARLFKAGNYNLRNIAKFSSLSVNSVRSVLEGKTGNIASYCLIAKALGTTLVDVVSSLKPAVATPPTP